MPRPLQPVERAAFFGECTLAGLRECTALTNMDNAGWIMHSVHYETCLLHAKHHVHKINTAMTSAMT